jgi:NTP pyrophosphatase (non-canonical NTP hydrolase)
MSNLTDFFDSKTNISKLRQLAQDFVDERDWNKYHNPKDLAISIAIEAAELMELFQWTGQKEVGKMVEDDDKLLRIKEELADVMILCLNMGNTLDIDLSQAIAEKIEKNKAKYPAELVRGNYRKYTQLKG